jgi:hypothetical protein
LPHLPAFPSLDAGTRFLVLQDLQVIKKLSKSPLYYFTPESVSIKAFSDENAGAVQKLETSG